MVLAVFVRGECVRQREEGNEGGRDRERNTEQMIGCCNEECAGVGEGGKLRGGRDGEGNTEERTDCSCQESEGQVREEVKEERTPEGGRVAAGTVRRGGWNESTVYQVQASWAAS